MLTYGCRNVACDVRWEVAELLGQRMHLIRKCSSCRLCRGLSHRRHQPKALLLSVLLMKVGLLLL
jgi:hypothetical protein